MADKTVFFTAPLRCFLFYRTNWNSREGKGLNCFHEENNLYDNLSLRVCISDSKIIDYLPMEISWITKYRTPRCYNHREGNRKALSLETTSSKGPRNSCCCNTRRLLEKLCIEPKGEEVMGTFFLDFEDAMNPSA